MGGREHLPKALLGLPCCGGLIEHRPGCTRRTNNVDPDPRDAEIARLKAEVERHLRCTSSYPEKQAACARKDDEIARLKAEVSEARRHAVGVMAAGFNRALDDAGAPAAESPGLRIYAMRAEIARLKRALAAGPAALRAAHPHLAGMVEAVQEAALKEEP